MWEILIKGEVSNNLEYKEINENENSTIINLTNQNTQLN